MAVSKHHDVALARAIWALCGVVIFAALLLAQGYPTGESIAQWAPLIIACVGFGVVVGLTFRRDVNPWFGWLHRRGALGILLVGLVAFFALSLSRSGNEKDLAARPDGGNEVCNLRQVGQAMMQHQTEQADYYMGTPASAPSLATARKPATPQIAQAPKPVSPENDYCGDDSEFTRPYGPRRNITIAAGAFAPQSIEQTESRYYP